MTALELLPTLIKGEPKSILYVLNDETTGLYVTLKTKYSESTIHKVNCGLVYGETDKIMSDLKAYHDLGMTFDAVIIPFTMHHIVCRDGEIYDLLKNLCSENAQILIASYMTFEDYADRQNTVFVDIRTAEKLLSFLQFRVDDGESVFVIKNGMIKVTLPENLWREFCVRQYRNYFGNRDFIVNDDDLIETFEELGFQLSLHLFSDELSTPLKTDMTALACEDNKNLVAVYKFIKT
jgi:hypothetical protein